MQAVAAFPGSDQAQLVDLPDPPSPGPGEVLVKSLRVGICGTDREILRSREPAVPPGEHFLVLGHECLGQIVELGPGVSGLTVGQQVLPMVRRPRGTYSRRTDYLAVGQFVERGIFYAHGFSAPYWVDQFEHLIPVPEGLGDLAVLGEPLSIIEKAIQQAYNCQAARLEEGMWRSSRPRVLITGLGSLAFTALVACVHLGWPTTVHGRDARDSFRTRLVERLGGNYLPQSEWSELGDRVEDLGYDLLLECTGDHQVFLRCAEALASCGVAVWLGSSRTPETVMCNLPQLMRLAVIRNHLYLGSVNASAQHVSAALRRLHAWSKTHPKEIHELFTERVPLTESPRYFSARPPHSIKTLVVYS